MMDLDESLRALYFAPIPLVVLDHTRSIKLLNRPAEALLDVSDSSCIGHRLDRYIAQSSRKHFQVALNEAVQAAGDATKVGLPLSTRLTMHPAEEGPTIATDVTISAWFATDPIFAADSSDGRQANAASVSSDQSPADYQSPSSPFDPTRSSTGTGGHLVHEAFYTLSVVPARPGARRDSPSSTHGAIMEQLEHAIMNNIDLAVMAVSKDTKIVVQNAACRQLLAIFKSNGLGPKSESDPTQNMDLDADEDDADFSWLDDEMTCWDEKFEKQLAQTDWPVYRCAVLGQNAPPVIMGLEAKSSKERLIFEISGKPLRNKGGFGEHIGGMITLRNVTAERLRLRQEVRNEGDLYFRQTCDAMPQLVWVTSPSGYHEWYSKSWYEYTGTDEVDSRGVGWQISIHEEDFPEAAKRWSYSLRTQELYETAYRVKRWDGVFRWFLGRALPMRDPETGKTVKWFGTCTDIHDQVEALANSRRAQSQLASVINHAAMTIWATDREGRITVAEGPGVRQLKLMAPGTPGSSDRGSGMQRGADENSEDGAGRPRSNSNSNSAQSHPKQQMIGRSIYSVWDPTLIRASMEKALNGEAVVEEMEIEGRWFRTSYTPMRAHSDDPNQIFEVGAYDDNEGEGEIIGVVGASLDITERKRAQVRVEESLMEKTRALAAEGAAREASRLKSEFLANMSHEIRTPIAGVIGLSELLLDEDALTPQQRDYVETIQRSAEGLLTVINDVLDFSKVEIGKLDVEKAPFNLEVLLRDAKRMLSFATQKKGLEFREAVALTYKGQVLGDVGRLRQVITNLLTNAIKFTAEGFISLEVEEMSEDAENLVVKFDVRDTGCGINHVNLSRLFQPFSQADPSTARRFGGTGLGLSISKNLVELMNGKIGLDSVEGEGSHAWFIVPFRKATEREGAAAKMEESGKIQPSSIPANGFSMGTSDAEKTTMMRPRRDVWILIAEDNVVNAQIASKNIKRMGFNCRTAENGLKALEELGRHNYDAILMDCQMPECDGYEATRKIRQSQNPDIRMLPVIALTASAIKGDRERALAAGMVDYLAKPVKRPALEATLCKWLYDSDARQSLSQYMTPARDTSSLQMIGHMAQAIRDPLASAGVSSAGEAEFPFPDISATTPLSVAMSGGEAMSPSTTQRLANVRLSPPSEAVIQRLKMPTNENSEAETFSLLRNGDALSAAAALLSARRASAEEVELLRRDAKERRPAPSPRSSSYQGNPSSSIGSPHVTFAEPAKVRDEAGTGAQPSKNPFPLFRRSSREQAGLGRDLDGEMMRATMPDEPALHDAMKSGDDT